MGYQFGFLEPKEVPGAEAKNRALFGHNTIGIDLPHEHAEKCGIANLSRSSDPTPRESLIERVFTFTKRLQRGSVVVVGREPNRETLVAMAIFALAETGRRNLINPKLIDWIGLVDRLGYQGACARRKDLDGLFSDWSIIRALDVVTYNPDYKPVQTKIRMIQGILVGHYQKGEIRTIAAQEIPEPTMA